MLTPEYAVVIDCYFSHSEYDKTNKIFIKTKIICKFTRVYGTKKHRT